MAEPSIKIYPLEKKKILKKFSESMLFWGIIFAIIIGLTVVMLSIMQINFLILAIIELIAFILLAAIYWWYENEYFKKYFYDIQPDFLVIKKGVFQPRETTLPYEKLQDVYLDQDLLDRAFNLWDLHVSTATATSGFEAHIDGVNISNGEKMKEIILQKIRENRK